MKKLFISIIILIFYVNTYAQTIDLTKISKSNIFSSDYIQDFEKCYRLSNDKLITISVKGEYLEIVKYDENLSPESKSNPIKFTYNQQIARNHFKALYLTNDDNLIVTFIQTLKEEKKIIIWANILSIEDEEFEFSEPIKLAEVKNVHPIKDFHIKFNQEKSQFVFVYYPTVEDPRIRNIIAYKIFNPDLELLSENYIKEISVRTSKSDFFRISNNGKFVSLVPIIDYNKQTAQLLVYIFDSDGTLENRQVFKIDSYQDIDITVSKNNILSVVGICKTLNKFYSRGVFNISIDLDDLEEAYQYKYHEFPIELVLAYESNNSKRTIQQQYKSGILLCFPILRVSKIIPHDEGYYTVFGQKSARYNPGSMSSFYYDYIVASYTNDDELLWIQKVPVSDIKIKNNTLPDNIIFKNNSVYIIHFDNKEKFNNYLLEKNIDKYHSADHLVIQKINEDGELERKILYNVTDIGLSKKKIPPHKEVENTKESTTFLFYTKENAAFLKVEIDD